MSMGVCRQHIFSTTFGSKRNLAALRSLPLITQEYFDRILAILSERDSAASLAHQRFAAISSLYKNEKAKYDGGLVPARSLERYIKIIEHAQQEELKAEIKSICEMGMLMEITQEKRKSLEPTSTEGPTYCPPYSDGFANFAAAIAAPSPPGLPSEWLDQGGKKLDKPKL